MGYHLSLRVEEASQVTVELIQADDRQHTTDKSPLPSTA
jgi:hypothetical protein